VTTIDPQSTFASHRVAIFGGKGGVGKTTCSAAAALAIANEDRSSRVLAISTDPAHSLKRAFESVLIPSNLTVHEFDADAAVDRFKAEHREVLRMFVDRGTFFDGDDIDRLLDLGLPGMDEAMAFLAILDAANDPQFTHIVVDTPPTGHTLRFLEMPRIFGTWVGFLEVLIQKDRAMRQRFARGAVDSPMERFLDDMNGRIARGKALWSDGDATAFFAVTAAEPVAHAETHHLIAELRRREVKLGGIIVNRFPASRADEALANLYDTPFDTDAPIWRIDDIPAGVDSGVLERFWSLAQTIEPDDGATQSPELELGEVSEPLEAPRGRRMVFFAGKGGVGKTTVACATALELARTAEHGVALVSTDPAHSLAHALGLAIGPELTPVAPGLRAIEIDAEADFDVLRREYAEEVSEFFDQIGGQRVDVVYDRAVLEGLMTFAPPGVDEAMGLLKAMDLLDDEDHDIIVVDTAPTGHFLRLMEMPELLQDWIRAIFRILQKYKAFIRLPHLSDRLVRLSRQLRTFRKMLADGDQAAVYVVGQLSQMSYDEVQSIAERCHETGLNLPAIVLNRVGHDLGAGPTLDDFRSDFKDAAVSSIGEGRAPRGVDDLAHLGASLYARGSA
jgi:arsenite-transporting ATPase